jgi:hypothetical protein
MRAKFVLTALLIALSGVAVFGAPLDPSLQQELLALYDRYNQAIAAGKLADAAGLRTGESRAQILAIAKQPKAAQAETLMMVRMMAPDSLTPVHATIAQDGNTASIIAVGTKTMPAGIKMQGAPKAGTVTRSELTLSFVREGQTWKFADQLFGMDPATIKPCHDAATASEAEYDPNRQSNTGGIIRRVEFGPDHTLVVIRVVDEENCLILPTRDWMLQHGGKPDKFVPWAMIEVDGLAHKTDKQRVLAEKWTVTDE